MFLLLLAASFLIVGSDPSSDLDLFALDVDSDSELTVPDLFSNDVDTLYSNQGDLSNLEMTTDNPYDCLSTLLLPSRRLRGRQDFCAVSETSGGAEKDSSLEKFVPRLSTEEDVEEYWCQKSRMEGFANIPVCDTAPNERQLSDIANGITIAPPFIPSGFENLLLCVLRKFRFHLVYEAKCERAYERY